VCWARVDDVSKEQASGAPEPAARPLPFEGHCYARSGVTLAPTFLARLTAQKLRPIELAAGRASPQGQAVRGAGWRCVRSGD
jgi:hypothetical protein